MVRTLTTTDLGLKTRCQRLFVTEVDVRFLLACSALMLLSGCHCWGWGECYSDTIDCIADRPLMLDNLYCPDLDVTRICMPDVPTVSGCDCAQCAGGCNSCAHEPQ